MPAPNRPSLEASFNQTTTSLLFLSSHCLPHFTRGWYSKLYILLSSLQLSIGGQLLTSSSLASPWHHAPPSPASTPRSSPQHRRAQRETRGQERTSRIGRSRAFHSVRINTKATQGSMEIHRSLHPLEPIQGRPTRIRHRNGGICRLSCV